MYAVVATGGKQVKVFQGDVVRVEKIDAPVGDTVELDAVHLLVTDDGIVAAPEALASARIVCEITNQGRAKKIRVFKKKRRKTYVRTYGHRQSFTELKVREIVTGTTLETPAAKESPVPEEDEVTPTAQPAPEAETAEAPAKSETAEVPAESETAEVAEAPAESETAEVAAESETAEVKPKKSAKAKAKKKPPAKKKAQPKKKA